MKNIVDYLAARKDVPFTEDPFNEVDGLILSELVYVRFDGLLDRDSDVDIKQVNDAFWKMHTESEMLESTSYSRLAPFMMRDMASSARFSGMRFKNYVSDISLKNLMQFSAMTFELPDGSDFAAFRGTDGTVAGFLEDFKFSFSTTVGQDLAVDYMNRYLASGSRPIRLGGHSKGGNLAVYAAVFCNRDIQDRIERVFSYDGPGFKMDVVGSDEYGRILPRVLSVLPRDCVVGAMMNSRYSTVVTESDKFYVFQHDPFQWHIQDNHFEEIPSRSELSLFFEKVVNNWLERFEEEKRAELLNALLSLMVEEDIVTADTQKLSAEFFYNLMVNSPKLSDENKALIRSSISEALLSTSAVAVDEIKVRSGSYLYSLNSVLKREKS